jgi:arginine exporter protein ArgO
MAAIFDMNTTLDREYNEFLEAVVYFSTVYFTAILLHYSAHAQKPFKLVEQYAVEVYAAVVMGLLAYHLVVKQFVRFR